ncbi:MAG: hypothetical protein ACR2GB_03940 [Nocardioidaceae bacterium]
MMMPMLAACGANFDAQSNQIYQPADGTNSDIGDVLARNVLIVADDSRGTLVSYLVNQTATADKLRQVTVTAGDGSKVESTVTEGGVELPPSVGVQVADKAAVQLQGEALKPGYFVEVEMTFERAAPLNLDVPIVDRSGAYADVAIVN